MESIAPLISAGTISAVSPRKLYSLLLDPFTSRSMLDITGTYDFTYAPFTLPEKVVAALLPADWRFLRDDELRDAGVMTLPRPPEGKRFCCIQIGLQQKTGPNLPFGIGKNTFFVCLAPIFVDVALITADVWLTGSVCAGGEIGDPIPEASKS